MMLCFRCIQSKTKDIYIEYIHTINGVIWNSQPFSAFLDLLKDELKNKLF